MSATRLDGWRSSSSRTRRTRPIMLRLAEKFVSWGSIPTRFHTTARHRRERSSFPRCGHPRFGYMAREQRLARAVEAGRRGSVDVGVRDCRPTGTSGLRTSERACTGSSSPSKSSTSRSLPEGVRLPPKDVPILLAAVESGANYLLTGDKDHFGLYFGERVAGVLILRPAEFLQQRRL